MPRTLQIRLDDGTMKPDTISAADLGLFLQKLDGVLRALSDEDNDSESVLISLEQIEPGSVGLIFKIGIAAIGLMGVVLDFLGDPENRALPPKAYAKAHELSKFLCQQEWTAEFRALNRKTVKLGPGNPIAALPRSVLRGGATLIGKCLVVGGSQPRIEVKTTGGGAPIRAKATEEIVRELAKRGRVYETVALSGEATWDRTSGKMLDFTVREILPYQPGRAAAAGRKLAELGRDLWAGVDPIQYTRGEGIGQ